VAGQKKLRQNTSDKRYDKIYWTKYIKTKYIRTKHIETKYIMTKHSLIDEHKDYN